MDILIAQRINGVELIMVGIEDWVRAELLEDPGKQRRPVVISNEKLMSPLAGGPFSPSGVAGIVEASSGPPSGPIRLSNSRKRKRKRA